MVIVIILVGLLLGIPSGSFAYCHCYRDDYNDYRYRGDYYPSERSYGYYGYYSPPPERSYPTGTEQLHGKGLDNWDRRQVMKQEEEAKREEREWETKEEEKPREEAPAREEAEKARGLCLQSALAAAMEHRASQHKGKKLPEEEAKNADPQCYEMVKEVLRGQDVIKVSSQ